MNDNNSIKSFFETIKLCITQNKIVKIILSKPINSSVLAKNISIKPVLIKNEIQLSFTFKYPTKDIVSNHSIPEALAILENEIGSKWLQCNLFSTDGEYQLMSNKKGNHKMVSHIMKNSIQIQPDLDHNRTKLRSLSLNNQYYLKELGITNQNGDLLKDGQKKFKQIHRYIELLSEELSNVHSKVTMNVVDFGSGKGYLTFALYDYLLQKKIPANIYGVEIRENLVNLCNELALKSGFDNLHFIADDIANFSLTQIDVLIALHACDIATDLAIHKGIISNAQIIVVAPCCHKQIRKDLDETDIMKPLMKYGLLKERQSELLTDGIRAMILEKYGYKVKIVEFVGIEHTPKNLMIIATKSKTKVNNDLQIAAIKQLYGIKQHYLERLLAEDNLK